MCVCVHVRACVRALPHTFKSNCSEATTNCQIQELCTLIFPLLQVNIIIVPKLDLAEYNSLPPLPPGRGAFISDKPETENVNTGT